MTPPRILKDLRTFAEKHDAYPDELEELDEAIADYAALTARLTVLADALREAHRELYGNASVALEFALHDLTSKRHHTEKTVGIVNEAQQSIKRAITAARAALGAER